MNDREAPLSLRNVTSCPLIVPFNMYGLNEEFISSPPWSNMIFQHFDFYDHNLTFQNYVYPVSVWKSIWTVRLRILLNISFLSVINGAAVLTNVSLELLACFVASSNWEKSAPYSPGVDFADCMMNMLPVVDYRMDYMTCHILDNCNAVVCTNFWIYSVICHSIHDDWIERIRPLFLPRIIILVPCSSRWSWNIRHVVIT